MERIGLNITEISGFEDYLVSDCGKVYSTKFNRFKERKLTPDKNGYLTVSLSPDGGLTRKTFKVHRLVAQAFIKKDIDELEVNHLNGVKSDNRVENLELVTHSDNMSHASSTDLLHKGEMVSQSKYTEKQIREVCRLLRDPTIFIREVAEATGVSYSICSSIYNGQKWKHIAEEYDFPGKRPRGRTGSLSDEDVVEVCHRLNRKQKMTQIARETGLSYYKILRVKNNTTYSEITNQHLHEAPTAIESTSSDGSE